MLCLLVNWDTVVKTSLQDLYIQAACGEAEQTVRHWDH